MSETERKWHFNCGNALARGAVISAVLLFLNRKWVAREMAFNDNSGPLVLPVLFCVGAIVVSGLQRR